MPSPRAGLGTSQHTNYHSMSAVTDTDPDDKTFTITAEGVEYVVPIGTNNIDMSDDFPREESVSNLSGSYDIDFIYEDQPEYHQASSVDKKDVVSIYETPKKAKLSSLLCCSLFSACHDDEKNNSNKMENKIDAPLDMKM